MRLINSTRKGLSLSDKLYHLISQLMVALLFCSLFLSWSGTAQSAISTYTDETAYTAALSSYSQIAESFEGTAWASVRTSISGTNILPGITNLGLTWQNRFFPNGGVTTSGGGGDVHQGSWRFYASPHGGYSISGLDCRVAGACGDGFIVSSSTAGKLYAVGGWFTGHSGPELKFLLDGQLINGADIKVGTGWQFFGVIDTNGFTRAEIRDSSGTLDDQNLLWADDFTIAVANTPPVNTTPMAKAGTDQSVLLGDEVILDGSGSTDADGDPLSYNWSLISVPTGSSAVLDTTDPVHPSFVADAAGSYVARLVVNDALLDSAPDTVIITTENSAPVASAGVDQSVFITGTVVLDGSGSTDVDGDNLSYQWSLISLPAGSSAVLDMTDPVHPNFVADVGGSYVAELIVNDGLLDSAPDRIRVSTENSAPIAHAGADQSVLVGNRATLYGGGSSDADGDPLSYSWSLISVPAGSAATLLAPTAQSPKFDIDMPGSYVIQLIVNDGLADSTPDIVNISSQNSAPVADAGADQAVFTGDRVILDGSGSNDVDYDSLTFRWALISQPAGQPQSFVRLDDRQSRF